LTGASGIRKLRRDALADFGSCEAFFGSSLARMEVWKLFEKI